MKKKYIWPAPSSTDFALSVVIGILELHLLAHAACSSLPGSPRATRGSCRWDCKLTVTLPEKLLQIQETSSPNTTNPIRPCNEKGAQTRDIKDIYMKDKHRYRTDRERWLHLAAGSLKYLQKHSKSHWDITVTSRWYHWWGHLRRHEELQFRHCGCAQTVRFFQAAPFRSVQCHIS